VFMSKYIYAVYTRDFKDVFFDIAFAEKGCKRVRDKNRKEVERKEITKVWLCL